MKIKTLICLMLMLIATQAFSQKREVAKALAQPRAMGEYYHYNCNKRGILVRYFNRYTRKHPEYIMGDTKTNYVKCYGGLSNAVVEIDILPKSEYDAYVCEKMTNHRKTDFTKSATVYAKNLQGWTKYTDVSWCGEVRDGMPHGQGIGFKKIGNNYIAISGNFKDGVPQNVYWSEYACTNMEKDFSKREYSEALSMTEYQMFAKTFPEFAKRFEDYACIQLTGHINSFSSTGDAYIKVNNSWISLYNAKWSGQVKNGKVHGYGYGFTKVGDKIYAFEGTFDEGVLDGTISSKYYDGFSNDIVETSASKDFATLTALLNAQSNTATIVNKKRRAMYNSAAESFLNTYNKIDYELYNSTSYSNYSRTLTQNQQNSIKNAINLMKPFMDNNFDPNRLKSKIDILEMADKVDSHIAYRTQTDFMVKKRNMITNIIGAFSNGLADALSPDDFDTGAWQRNQSHIRSLMSDANQLQSMAEREGASGYTLLAEKAELFMEDKLNDFNATYSNAQSNWNERQRREQEERARYSSNYSSNYDSYSSSSSSSSYSKNDPEYWQNKIGSKIRFVTSYNDGDQGLFGNNVDLIVEGYLKEVEDGFADWYYHVDVTKITIEEDWLDSASNSGDRKVLYKAQNEWLGKVTEFAEDNIRDMDEL